MTTPHDLIVRIVFVSCVFFGLFASGSVLPALGQVPAPIIDPAPGSILGSTTVKFIGEYLGQGDNEQHWLTVETSSWARDIFHEALPITVQPTATVSGLPSSGTLYVRYWTYTNTSGWLFQEHTYTMAVESACTQGVGQPRFVANGEEVCDKTTGLRWQLTPGAPGDTVSSCGNGGFEALCLWQEAVDYCAALGGGSRLPEVKELISLLDYSQIQPALPLNHPFINVPAAAGYWSATPRASDSTLVWGAHFFLGDVGPIGKGLLSHAWCVR